MWGWRQHRVQFPLPRHPVRSPLLQHWVRSLSRQRREQCRLQLRRVQCRLPACLEEGGCRWRQFLGVYHWHLRRGQCQVCTLTAGAVFGHSVYMLCPTWRHLGLQAFVTPALLHAELYWCSTPDVTARYVSSPTQKLSASSPASETHRQCRELKQRISIPFLLNPAWHVSVCPVNPGPQTLFTPQCQPACSTLHVHACVFLCVPHSSLSIPPTPP